MTIKKLIQNIMEHKKIYIIMDMKLTDPINFVQILTKQFLDFWMRLFKHFKRNH